MERGGHRQHQRALGALRRGRGGGGFDGRLDAGNHQLATAIVIGDLHGSVRSALGAGGLDIFIFQPDDGRHRTLAGGNRGLHGVAADAQQPRGVGNREHAGRAQGGVFAERMAGDIACRLCKLEAACLKHAHQRHGDRHQRRLGIGGQGQSVLGAFEDHRRELFAERRIDLVKDRPGFGKSGSQVLAHANGLAALPRKCECCGHVFGSDC
jgi:hypothetical protein